jgi:hypothetical protein
MAERGQVRRVVRRHRETARLVPPRTARAVLAVVAVAAMISPAGRNVPPAAATAGVTHYVDSGLGNDAGPGTSPDAPWRTLAPVQRTALGPGSSVLLKRGGQWAEKLTISASGVPGAPIVIGSYGRGTAPRLHSGGCLDLLGSHIVVTGLHTDSCKWAGISISGNNNLVRDSVSTGNVAGIYVRPGATSNRIIANTLQDNNRMSVLTATPSGDDSGAWGVLVRGDFTEVAHNLITGSDSFSHDWVRDGAAIEIYGGRNNEIHHNRAIDNNMFSELGDPRAAYNVFSYNLVVSRLERGGFLTTRGANSRYGPVLGTELYNNSVLLQGARSEGFVCHAGCGPHILRMRNNVIQAVQKAGFADVPFDDGYGVYFGGRIQFSPGPGSRIAPPQFADPASGDLRLLASSPGVDAGDPSARRYGVDLDGKPVPLDGDGDGTAVVDIGAYELG